MFTGVDLYQKYNQVTDWSALARSISFAWLKVSDGTGPAAVPADAYVNGCVQHGIPWGGYHFAEPGDPIAQADVFVAQLRRLGFAADRSHLAPALDMENGGIPVASRPAFCRAFLERVHGTLGGLEALYASTSWLALLSPDSWPYDWDLTWAAEYGPNDGTDHAIVHYGGRVDVHQYTSRATAPGVVGLVDFSHTDKIPYASLGGSFMAALSDAEQQELLYKVRQVWDSFGASFANNGGQWWGYIVTLLGRYMPAGNNKDPKDALSLAGGFAPVLMGLVDAVGKLNAKVDDLAARPAADVDEAALARELTAAGLTSGATEDQVRAVVREFFTRAAG